MPHFWYNFGPIIAFQPCLVILVQNYTKNEA